MAIIKTISDLLWGMPLIVLILLAGIIFTVGSKFFQIAHLKHILKNTIGTLFSKKDNGKGRKRADHRCNGEDLKVNRKASSILTTEP